MQTIKIVRTSNKRKIIFLLIMLIALIAAYLGGYYKFEYDVYEANGGKKLLVKQLLLKEQALDEREKQKFQLEQRLLLAEKTSEKLQLEIKQLQQKMGDMNADLVLYKSIIDPESEDLGVDVHKIQLLHYVGELPENFKFEPENQSLYVLKLTLINYAVNKSFMKGLAGIKILDKQDKENEHFTILDERFAPVKSNKIKIGFKYYQQFNGYVLIDKQFDMRSVSLSVKESRNKFEPVELDLEVNQAKEINYVGQ